MKKLKETEKKWRNMDICSTFLVYNFENKYTMIY